MYTVSVLPVIAAFDVSSPAVTGTLLTRTRGRCSMRGSLRRGDASSSLVSRTAIAVQTDAKYGWGSFRNKEGVVSMAVRLGSREAVVAVLRSLTAQG